MAFILEQLERGGAQEGSDMESELVDVHSYEECGKLRIMFENAAKKLAINNSSDDSNLKTLMNREELLNQHDNLSVSLKMLDDLQVLGLKPDKLIKEVIENSSEQKLFKFSCDAHDVQCEQIKLKHEFQRKSQWDQDDEHHQHSLLQMHFEKFFPNDSADNKFKAYCWKENMPSGALLQAIQTAKSNKNIISSSFSKYDGLMMVCMMSPGPLGCLKYNKRDEIKVGVYYSQV